MGRSARAILDRLAVPVSQHQPPALLLDHDGDWSQHEAQHAWAMQRHPQLIILRSAAHRTYRPLVVTFSASRSPPSR